MKVQDVMTPDPVVCPSTTSTSEAAAMMRDRSIGDVLVQDGGELLGIVTDRDLVVRVMADMRDPAQVSLGEVCTGELWCVEPTSDISDAISLMREHALRRIPVMSGGRPVGIVTLGDLAIELDSRSALGEISHAPPNS